MAHRGQKYGDSRYFETHVEDVVARCESNKHCTYGHITLAYLHDVVEDTEVTLEDLRTLGLFNVMIEAVDAITKRKSEDYAAYLTRVLENSWATFVKYHDLLSNIAACQKVIEGHSQSGLSRAHAEKLIRTRYNPAIERIRATEPYWLHEGCRYDD